MSTAREHDATYNLLKWIAILSAVALVAYLMYDHFRAMGPGDVKYVDGSNLFEDRQYERAARYFHDALEQNPDHVFALRGLANANVQLKRFDEALSAIDRAIAIEPNNACNLATRGIIFDHMRQHKKAMQDYEHAIAGCPEATEGMHWLDRLLYNVHERPPTVVQRLVYLREQMKLPENQRVLSIPEIDKNQLPYER